MQWLARDRSAIIGVIMTILAAVGCDRKKQAQLEPTPMPTVTVSQPIEREISDDHEFTGHTEAIKAVDVHARVSGFIDRVAFEDGAIVKEGDLLFQIDPRPFDAAIARDEAALASAKARAKRASADLARAGRLIKGKTITQEDYDRTIADQAEAAAAVKQAEASLTTSNLDREYSTITAAVGGRVSRAIITKGNLVNGTAGKATLLTTIVPIDPIYASFDVDEPTILRVGARARDPKRSPVVEMRLAHETGFPRSGRLDFLDNKVDPATGTIKARAEFPNPEGVLTPGMFVNVRVRSSEKRPALLVSDRAVGLDQGRKYLLVTGPENKVEYREVVAGPIVDGLRAIEKGLQSSEWVIVNGLQRARPGSTVQIEKTTMPLPVEAEDVGGREESTEPQPSAGAGE